MLIAYLDRAIIKEELRDWLADVCRLVPEAVVVCEDPSTVTRWPPLMVGMGQERGGAFSVTLEVFGDDPKFGEEEVGTRFMQALCRRFSLRALVGDESPDPYTWVMVDRRGNRWWIAVDVDLLNDREEIAIEGPCIAPRGSIATAEPIDTRAVVAAFAEAYRLDERHFALEQWDLEHREVGTLLDGAYAVVGASHYRHFTTVSVFENPRRWLPAQQAAGIWIGKAVHAARRLGVPLCIHHEAFSVVSNIPGGSDSEAHCYEWTGATLGRVIFKLRRTHW